MLLPWWASWVVALVSRLVNDWAAKARAEQSLRDLGAATQANTSRVEAERQERVAHAAGAQAQDKADDPRDLRDEP